MLPVPLNQLNICINLLNKWMKRKRNKNEAPINQFAIGHTDHVFYWFILERGPKYGQAIPSQSST